MKPYDGEPTHSVEDVVRNFLARDLANWIKFDPLARMGDDEGIHQLRVSARRLRAEFGVVHADIRHASLTHLRRELRWVGSLLGRQRDLDVLRHTLVHAAPQPDRSTSLVNDVERRRSASQLLVRDALNSRRYRHLVVSLAEAAIEPPCRRSATRGANVLLPSVQHHVSSLQSLRSTCGDNPSDELLHRVRIAVKRCRYGAEVAIVILGPDAEQLAESFARAQTVLGDLHDTVVALTYLNSGTLSLDVPEADLLSITHVLASTRTRLRSEWRPLVDDALALARSLDLASPSSTPTGNDPTSNTPSREADGHESIS